VTDSKLMQPGEGRELPEQIRAVPVRHPGRWVAAVVVGVLFASIGYSFARNPNIQWNIVWERFFSQRIIDGVVLTIELTVVSMLVGVILGVILASMRQSPNPVLRASSWFYIWLFRGTPVYVQILFWFSIAALYSQINIGVPFGGAAILSFDSNTLITAIVAGFLALSLNEGAYMAEIVRSGIISVDHGQTEAANALGMTRLQTTRYVVLPQAMRVIVPPTGNETINMLKTTSLVSAISITELLYASQKFSSVDFRVIPMLVLASIWYLILTSVLYVCQYYIERRYGRGTARELPPTPRQRVIAFWRTRFPAAEGS